MTNAVAGSWKLVAWRRIEAQGSTTYPLGRDATGLLVYTPDGRMIVQMTAANRPALPTSDPLGGEAQDRAAAYSTCLAYFGSYEVKDDTIVHHVEECLYPNWSNTEQVRSFSCDGNSLLLRTPPSEGAHGSVVNEIAWVRDKA